MRRPSMRGTLYALIHSLCALSERSIETPRAFHSRSFMPKVPQISSYNFPQIFPSRRDLGVRECGERQAARHSRVNCETTRARSVISVTHTQSSKVPPGTCVPSATHTSRTSGSRAHRNAPSNVCQVLHALSLSLAAELRAGRTSGASANFGATNVGALSRPRTVGR